MSSSGGLDRPALVMIIVGGIVIFISLCLAICRGRIKIVGIKVIRDAQFLTHTMDKFLNDIEKDKPFRFTTQQLKIVTDNFSYLLGSGGFGSVYKGVFSDGTIVAVKVLFRSSDKGIQEQFMAEIGTLGKVHHFNLVKLFGFCVEKNLIAIVYEYMGNSSLDKYLFKQVKALEFEKLHEIAIGTARGIAYLHEECQQRIIHYDIKPANILLDMNFNPKVADFGLAKLCNRDNTHISMTGGRGTPGYAAPELWMPFPVTHKCDVYSFGMLLFEIIGGRRNVDTNVPESQEWFPMWVWKKIDAGELQNSALVSELLLEKHKEMVERMIKVALWCVQYRPESRPMMSAVVKMLEGSVEISQPLNPFQYLMDNGFATLPQQYSSNNCNGTTATTSSYCDSSVIDVDSNIVTADPI
ncbi:rust resistance kinase Lr10-like [Arachis stenosperma]|uniref:rust resistance kinase Lr10-like n=1 Tax=Arachis stenosperma TaxID=217475 RepID=UPI0025ABCD59|nr:rust resistance kinase Lr10-like [Arachis stenosperma]